MVLAEQAALALVRLTATAVSGDHRYCVLDSTIGEILLGVTTLVVFPPKQKGTPQSSPAGIMQAFQDSIKPLALMVVMEIL